MQPRPELLELLPAVHGSAPPSAGDVLDFSGDAVQGHGEDSRQARKRREELEEAKRRCGDHHDMDHHDDHDQH